MAGACGAAGVPGAACCVRPGCFVCPWAAARQISGVAMPRQISGRRVACPPARHPRRELRSTRLLEARPGPAGPAAASNRAVLVVSVLSVSLRHRPPAPRQVPPAPSTPVGCGVLMRIHIIAEPTPNSACNSPTTLSNPVIRSLELQRFLTLLKLHPIELHATFLRPGPPPTGTAARPAGACGLVVALVLDRKLCFG